MPRNSTHVQASQRSQPSTYVICMQPGDDWNVNRGIGLPVPLIRKCMMCAISLPTLCARELAKASIVVVSDNKLRRLHTHTKTKDWQTNKKLMMMTRIRY